MMTRSALIRHLVKTIACILVCHNGHAFAQSLELTSDISRPIPNAGHDYVKGLNETVNPANGSLSIKVTLPAPASRGLSLPFSLVYNSGVVHHSTVETYNGGAIVVLQMDGLSVPTDRSINGWSDTIPYATASSFVTHIPPNPDGETAWCGVSTGYQLYDASGQSHQLGLTAIAPVRQNSGGVGVDSGYCQTIGYPMNAQSWSANGYTGRITGGTCNGVSSANMAPGCIGASPTFTATDLDNTVYTFPDTYASLGYDSEGQTPLIFPTSIEDRNGNIINIAAGQPDGQGNTTPTIVSDTAGRQFVKLTYVPLTINPASYEVGDLTYTIGYTTTQDNYTAASNQVAPESGNSQEPCNLNFTSNYSGKQVIQTIDLPNGTHYTFQYETRFGLIKEIDYPNGGWVKYTWLLSNEAPNSGLSDFVHFPAQGQPLGSNDLCNYQYAVPVIRQRDVGYSVGSSSALTQVFTYTTNWNPNAQSASQWLTKTTTVATTDNITGKTYKTLYTYVPVTYQQPPTKSASLPPQIPVEQSVVTYDWGPSATPILTENKTWADPYAMSSQTTVLPSGKSTTVGYQYDNDRVTEKDEYDFGQTSPSRVTTYGYYSSVYESSGLSTPCQIVVHTGSATGPRVAETDAYYDGGTATCASGKGATASVTGLPVLPGNVVTHDETAFGSSAPVFRGNITTMVRWNSNGTSPTTTYTYDETGQRISMTEPCGNATCSDMAAGGHTTTYSYSDKPDGSGDPAGDSNAYLTQITKPAANGMALNEQFFYDYELGFLTKSIDENGNATNYYYYGAANLNRPQQIVGPADPNNGNQSPITSYQYNDSIPSVTTSVLMSGMSGGPSKTTTLTMDGMGHVITTDHSDSNSYGDDFVDSKYDGTGHLYSVSNPYRHGSDPSAPQGTTFYTYDALGRAVIQKQPDGSTQQWCRDGFTSSGETTCPGNLSSLTNASWTDYYDETGRHWQRVSDGLGRLTAVMEPEASTTPTLETDYQYNPLDELVKVDQWGGSPVPAGSTSDRVRTFIYDSLGRLTNSCNPEAISGGSKCGASGPWGYTYSYDANGNPSTLIDARAITTTYTYDVLNRPTLKSYTNDPLNTPGVSYNYDLAVQGWGWGSAPNPQTNVKGRLTNLAVGSPGQNAWIVYGYDTSGRLTLKSECLPLDCGSNHHDLHYKYDLAGDMTFYDRGTDFDRNSSSPNQGYYFGGYNLAYDIAGNIKSVTADTADNYHPAMVFGNGVYTAFGSLSTASMVGVYLQARGYDNRERYTSLFVENTATQPIWNTTTGYYTNGSVKSSTDTYNGSWTYLYGDTNRLAQVVGSALTLGYTYDHWGNRTSQLITTGSGTAPQWTDQQYNANNQLTTTWTHDAAGNVTYDGFHNYTYDAENRIRTVDGSTTYAYDGEDNRVATLSGGSVQKEFLYDFQGRLMTEIGLDYKAARANIYVGNQLFAEDAPDPYLPQDPTATLLRISDQVGTLRARWDVGSNWVGACSSLPYGDAMNCSVSPSDMQFTSKQRDSESDLDYFGARYYNSTRGRFTSPDWSAKAEAVPYAKLDNPQSLNLYAYAGNNPASMTDPTGHYICDGNRTNCQLVSEALSNIREAVNSGNLTKDEAAALNKVLTFYGKAGNDNGVTVGFQKAGATMGGTKTVHGHTTITLSLRAVLSDPAMSQNGASPDTEAAAQAAHEGEHGVQQQDHGMPRGKAQEKAGEVDAYSVQSYVNKGEWDTSAYWSEKSNAAIWSTDGGYSAAAVNDYADQSTAAWCQAGGNCK